MTRPDWTLGPGVLEHVSDHEAWAYDGGNDTWTATVGDLRWEIGKEGVVRLTVVNWNDWYQVATSDASYIERAMAACLVAAGLPTLGHDWPERAEDQCVDWPATLEGEEASPQTQSRRGTT